MVSGLPNSWTTAAPTVMPAAGEVQGWGWLVTDES